ncbi:MAG: hypothetical protein KKH28_04645 [Elusimicrobia bacterium]|nr:hypothetical protein [Elusimicrobiota bacterium]
MTGGNIIYEQINVPEVQPFTSFLHPSSLILLHAGVPLKINFQGRLEESGQPVEGAKNFIFKIYDALSGGSVVWTSQAQSVEVANGVFSVVLETGTPVNLSTAAFAGARYVEITVDGVPLSPRQEMVSAPYAMVAQALAPDARISLSNLEKDPSSASTINDPANAVDWSQLKNVPAGLADGTDDTLAAELSTAAIVSGRFGDDRVYITTGAVSGLGALALADSEADPVFTAHVSYAVVSGDLVNWNAAYGWGSHASAGYASAAALNNIITSTGTIQTQLTDVAASTGSIQTSLNNVITSTAPLAGYADWDAAYGWGSHAAAGYSGVASTQVFTGANTFASTAAFTAQNASLPGVFISSGLIVLDGRAGIGVAAPNSRLSVGGAISFPIKTITFSDSPYTVTENDSTILVDGTTGATGDTDINLPNATAIGGRIYTFKRVDVQGAGYDYPVNILPYGGQDIEGALSYVLFSAQWEAVTLQSDGADWIIFCNN